MAFSTAEIKPGDVLLFHGKSFISWAIRTFDGTEVNHAAVALPGGFLAEAAGQGLHQRAVPVPGGGEFIRVHRLKDSSDLDPVVTKANAFLAEGHLYAYQQLVLLALLALTRRVPLPHLARRLIRSALDHATTAVMDLLPVGASWMICSEYVYRSYHEAVEGDVDPYELSIAGVSFGDGGVAGEKPLLEWGIENARDVVVMAPATFGGVPGPEDPVQRVAAIEADLAPLVVDYAQQLYAAGEITNNDLPPLVDPSFGPPVTLPPVPSDDELLASIASFSAAFVTAQGRPLPIADPAFGAVGGTIAAAALKGALEGLRNISVDANYVTPGDLLHTPSLEFVGQLA